MAEHFGERRMKIFADAETINGAVVTRSIFPFHETAQNPPILLETALQRFPEQQADSPFPLVLYISRVAGTKNIILSNFKPGHNSVTRTDVESSLYFVQPMDPTASLFTPGWSPDLFSSESSDLNFAQEPTTDLLADDLASSHLSLSLSCLDSEPKPDSLVSSPPDLADHPIFRQPAQHNPALEPYGSSGSTSSPMGSIRRRKLVPAALEARRASIISTMVPPINPPYEPAEERPAVSPYLRAVMEAGARKRAAEGRALSVYQTPPPPPPIHRTRVPRPPSSIYPPPSVSVPNMSHMLPTPRPTPSPSPPNASRLSGLPLNVNIQGTVSLPSPLGMSLRVIRWHHSSGQVWPVSLLVSAPLPTKEARRKSIAHVPREVPCMRIIMENPGYAPFADDPATVFEKRGLSGLPMMVRDVGMAYEKSWTKRLLQHSRGKKSEGGCVISPTEKAHHHRSLSGGEEEVNLTAGPGLKKEGYTFITPWGTRCHFRTGKGGGSLICYHSVPLYSHKRTMSTVSGHQSPEKEDRRRYRDIPVSELRFNLPGKSLFGGSSENNNNNSHGIFGGFGSGHGEDDDDDDDDDDGDPNWLGKEKAGGGRHGDHAKMGKLIVLEGGRDMIDLVVSANIGIWWRTWKVAH